MRATISSPIPHRSRRSAKVLRGPLRRGLPPLLALALSALALTLSATAAADMSVCAAGSGSAAGQCQDAEGIAVDTETGRLYVNDVGNNRISVFNSDGSFASAFGWGVANGAAELQSCGPQATPPTANCLKGLSTAGAGSLGASNNVFGFSNDIAVDNDPASPSHHDVYVLDGRRVQKFGPEGHFLLTWGGGVITGGASGTGVLTSGSTQISSVKTTSKSFATGQTITGAGIPAETKILAIGTETITLSKAATASGTGVALSVAEGAGNKPVNEVDVLVNKDTNPPAPPNFVFNTLQPNPPPTRTELGQQLPTSTTGPELQAAIEALPNVGPGNVAVIDEKVSGIVHEYTLEFKGTRYSDTDVPEVEIGGGVGNREVTPVENGGGAAEICPAAIAASCSAGIPGDSAGQFGESAHLAVGPGGVVEVVDCVRVSRSVGCENRLQKFEPSGDFIEELALPQSQNLPTGLTVDSGGDFYAATFDTARKYDAGGNLLKELPGAIGVGALVIDASNHLFTAEFDHGYAVIAEYDAADNIVRRFGYGAARPAGLAPFGSAGGDIFSAEGGSVIYRSFPAPGPIVAPLPCKAEPLGNFKATLNAQINPEGSATSFKFEYLTQAQFEAGGFSNPATKSSAELTLAQVDYKLQDAAVQVTGLQPETTYHCRVVAENSDVATPVLGVEGSFKTKEGFEFGSAWASAVGEEAATVNVQGNPLGLPATGEIEYVSDADYQVDGFAQAKVTPEGAIDFGASEAMQLRSVALGGLTAGTLYHYRLRVLNGTPPGGFICPESKLACPGLEHTFRTRLPGGEADQRRYELVSPGEKNSAEVAVPSFVAGFLEPRFVRIQAGATSGEAVTYTSWTSFGQAEGAQGTSQYLSKRTASGWQTENISPGGFLALPLMPPYGGFSPDLRFGAFKISEPLLTPDCRKGLESLYLRDNETGELRCLSPEAPGAPKSPCLVYAGASEDGSRAFLAGAPEDGEILTYGLYESTASGTQLISVFPNGEPAPATIGTAFGPGGKPTPGADIENCQVTRTTMRHAISADGSRAFWTYVPEASKKEPNQLYARINGSETVQLDAKQGAGTSGEGVFVGASEDGSVAYFTDTNRLVPGAKPENGKPDLYRYQFGLAQPLTDLTKGSEPGDVKGLVGISDDGAYAYFVAGAVLSAEPNQAGDKAEAGKNNLYLYHEGKTSFIAALADEDQGDWAANPREMSARVSPDGRHLAFLSLEAGKLAGYDNTIAEGEHCQILEIVDGVKFDLGDLVGSPLCKQAFIYEADGGELTCASCNPSGSRPLGPTAVPGWSNDFEGPRFLSDDGQRLFFQSYDALLPADENGLGDVYEFERPGTGSCSEAGTDFDSVSGGCHFLLSSGKSEDETYLVDASSDGRDVFLSTRQSLTGWDVNENYDVYDYREGGGFPEPVETPICQGEACKPPVGAAVPPASSPSTPNFRGQGNPVTTAPKKHKHKKKRHKAKSKKKSHHGRANRDGRTSR